MKFVISFFLLFLSLFSFGQGCSDAGVCTMPALNPSTNQSRFQIELRTSLESTEPGALIISPQIWLRFRSDDKFSADLKLPLWFVNDPHVGSYSGFSDPMFTFSWLVLEKKEIKTHVIAGMRIGVGNAIATGILGDLPMDYQPTLGTTDLLLGGKVSYHKFSASLAFQIPVWQYNQNKNVILKYTDTPVYWPNLKYHRKTDLALRIDKVWEVKKWSFQIGVLPIFHLSNDELREIGNSENAQKIEGSSGLTLNIPFAIGYQTDNWFFGINAGFPVLVRDERPDGLTRKYVVQPRIAVSL